MSAEGETAAEISIRYRVMDEVMKEIDRLEKEDLPMTDTGLQKLRVRLLESGGLADPTGDPRNKR